MRYEIFLGTTFLTFFPGATLISYMDIKTASFCGSLKSIEAKCSGPQSHVGSGCFAHVAYHTSHFPTQRTRL